MAGFRLLIGVFLVTFDYGHTGDDIRDTGSTKQQILVSGTIEDDGKT